MIFQHGLTPWEHAGGIVEKFVNYFFCKVLQEFRFRGNFAVWRICTGRKETSRHPQPEVAKAQATYCKQI